MSIGTLTCPFFRGIYVLLECAAQKLLSAPVVAAARTAAVVAQLIQAPGAEG